MLNSIFSRFFHTIFKDLTKQILFPKMQQNAPFCIFLKKIPFYHGFIILYLYYIRIREYLKFSVRQRTDRMQISASPTKKLVVLQFVKLLTTKDD